MRSGETLEWREITRTPRPAGLSTVWLRCPHCAELIEANVRSLAAQGKRCPGRCGTLILADGTARSGPVRTPRRPGLTP